MPKNYDDIVALVEQLAARRDPYNHHAPRVALQAVQLAQAFGLSTHEVYMVNVGAQLHDIGKLLQSADRFNQPRKLTEDEMSLVRVHPYEGYQIAHALGYAPIICDVILHHHENVDGTGYPDRLKGNEISVYARIVRIVDTYDAMTSRRPYRLGLSPQNARLQMEAETNLSFDADLLRLFFEKVFTDAS